VSTPAKAAARGGADSALIRLAILATALAVVLGLTLLIQETPMVFTAFMVLGPALIALAFVLLGIVILRELRDRKVL
jgi:archaellum biogenesis protein FlaJ (TadC family)